MRDHGLDAARAAAMLLGVFFHAAISFMATPVGWAARDRSASFGVDVFVFVSHSFRMPLFFLLSGYFSRLLVEKRGIGDFLRQRLARLGLPLLIFWPPTAISLFYLWRWGRTLPDQPPPLVSEWVFFTAPSHLWFIYYLLLIALGAAALARWKAGPWMDRWIRPWTLAPLTAVALLPMKALEIETPVSFVPDLRILAFYALFFVYGWALRRTPERVAGFGRRLPLLVVLAIVSFAALAPLGRRMGTSRSLGELHGLGQLALACFSWSLVSLFLGLFVRFFSAERRWVSWVSDSAYWVYLAHLPLCVLLQVWVAPKPWPGPLKYALVALGTLAACLASYRVVRTSRLGELLHGPRKALTVAPAPARI